MSALAQEKDMKKGRPRSDASKRAILDATRRLLSHTTVQKLSIEAIAKKAGVGKTTIYRWWPSKASVAMDAIFTQPGFQNVLPSAPTAAEGIYNQLDKVVAQLNGKNGRIVAQIISEIQDDYEAVENFHKSFMQERCFELAKLVDQGMKSGEFRDDIDIETTVDTLMGPIIFRLMSGLVMTEDYAEKVITAILPGIKA
ncbi:MAG: TetR/AcrR family transcriptional regulator [Pseudomonadota bacterium]